MKTKEFMPEKEVILEEDFSYTSDERRTTNDEKVSVTRYKSKEVIIEARVNAPKFLVLSDTYYPGWKASVDEKPSKIYRADYILRAVYLEPGKHIVRFTYDPFSFKIGTIITLFIIFVLVYVMFFRHPGVIRHIE
jgi:uncharacterized membrane protein YfhO